VLWKRPACTTEANTCAAGIAVSAGRVLIADHDEKNDYYRCLDAEKGTEIWTRTFPNPREMEYGPGPRATPLIHQGKVYVLSAFGELYAFDLKTGKTVWEKDSIKDFAAPKAPKWGYCGSPLVAGGKLIVNPGGKTSIAALDPETGKLLWAGAGAGPNYSSFIAGTFGGVEQVVGNDDASLSGWDLKTGKRLWSVAMEIEPDAGYIVPTPVAVGGRLLLTDQKNGTQLFAFDKEGVIVEEPVAKNDSAAPEVVTPVAVGDLVLASSKKLICLDAANGLNTLWTSKVKPFSVDCHLIVSQDLGLAFSKQGVLALFSFDRQGVKLLGQAKLCEQTPMHPTLAGGRLYVRDSEFFYCYDLGLR
jgi:outer membrane protein assembly factor BamB